jgi:GNAT superfamily N-acetyltransferase
VEWTNDHYRISDDSQLLDAQFLISALRVTYWASDRSPDTIQRSITNSVCLGLYRGRQQFGFCRAVTDRATFSWICDVIIDPEHRGKGLGKWMVRCLLDHPAIKGTTCVLRTEDAHGLYERFGFKKVEYLRRAKDAR